MNNASIRELVEEINSTRTQTSASTKDEVRVMRAMLNDPTFKVDVWGRNGIEGQYCPFDDARTMIANIIKDTTKMTTMEATELANNYEFGKQEASIMVGLSKEFINTYIETGRKLPLGGRETSNISIAKKVKESKSNNSDSDNNETTKCHGSLRVFSPAPSWINKKQ